jgi:hypothetical protein
MTQKDLIREHLIEHKSITPLEALKLYGVYRLSDVIFRLRDNYDIATFTMEGTDRNGHPTRFAKYVWKGEKNG